MRSLAVLVTCIVGLWTTVAVAQTGPEIHCKHWYGGYPWGTPVTNDLIIRDLYALSHNDERKCADWVAYYLSYSEVAGFTDGDRKWYVDPWLDSSETLTLREFNSGNFGAAGYQRGHQAPLASFYGTNQSACTDYISNITPQIGGLNGNLWARLEHAERMLVLDGDILLVYTGPVFASQLGSRPRVVKDGQTLPEFGYLTERDYGVPDGYWKIFIRIQPSGKDRTAASTDELPEVAAFLFPHETPPPGAGLADYVTTVEAVEAATQLTFFWMLPESEQALLKVANQGGFIQTVLDASARR